MHNILVLFSLSLFLISCTEKKDDEINNEQVIQDEQILITQNKSNQEIVNTSVNSSEKSGLPDGSFSTKYSNGTTKTEGVVLNGKRSGLWISYHPNGNKQSENIYVNGVLNGKTVVYHPNGQVMYIGYYKNGKYDGSWIYFSKEGEELKSVSFKNGKQL